MAESNLQGFALLQIKKTEENDVREVEWNSASGTLDPWYAAPMGDLDSDRKLAELPLEGSKEPAAPGTNNSEMQVSGSSSPSTGVIMVPDSPTLPVQFPASPALSI